MIKVIIVDDEDIIREGISNYIDWKSLELELVGQASNGKEAAELVRAAEPEIIITDVKMPMMTGIELLALAKEIRPDCIVIMISSYDQFEYAQQSLNLGAYAYLLKPIDTDKLIDLLQAAVGKIKHLMEEETERNIYKDVLKQAHTDMFENKIKVMVFGGKPDSFNYGEEQYLKQFTHVTIITVYTDQAVFREEIFMTELEGKLTSWAEEQRAHLEVKRFQNQNRMTIFCVFHKTEKSILVEKLYNIYIQYYRLAVVGISSEVDLPGNFFATYKQSLEAVEYRFFTEHRIIYYCDIQKEIHTSFKDMPDWSKELQKCFGCNKDEDIRVLVDDFLHYMYEMKPSRVIIRTAVSSVLLEMIRLLREGGGKPEDIYLSVSDTIAAILNEADPERMGKQLLEVLLGASEYRNRLEQLRPNSVVFKAKRYIDENYQNPSLRLDDVANHVYINPSYFSSMFSKESKVSFGDYLTMIRMEKAKELLKNTPLKVYEVAQQVGYQNVSWFNVAFKKYTGVKPGEFRR